MAQPLGLPAERPVISLTAGGALAASGSSHARTAVQPALPWSGPCSVPAMAAPPCGVHPSRVGLKGCGASLLQPIFMSSRVVTA